MATAAAPADSSAGHTGSGYHGGGGYYRGGGYGYGGAGIFLGLGGYGYGYGGYGPGYGYPPDYYACRGALYYYAPPAYRRPLPSRCPGPAEGSTNALIEVRVPEAEIWFEGDKTTQTGNVRQFVTPAVPPGQTYTYDIRARWTGGDGKVVDQLLAAQFRARQRLTVDFTCP